MQWPANPSAPRAQANYKRDTRGTTVRKRLGKAKGPRVEMTTRGKKGQEASMSIHRQQQQVGAKQAQPWPLFGRSQRVAHRVQNMEQERYPK